MELVGVYLSPFVRRVAVALNVWGIPFDRIPASVVDARDTIGRFNRLVRVPCLVLDDGDVLIDSHQILLELDHLVGPDRAMTPAEPTLRRRHGQILANLTGAMEKLVASFYERVRRPEDKRWDAWASQCLDQAVGGLEAAEELAGHPDGAAAADTGHLFGPRITHADIAAVIAYEFGAVADPARVTETSLPRLAALAARLGPMPSFASTRIGPASADAQHDRTSR